VKFLVALSTAALLLWTTGSTYAQWDVYNNDSPRWKMEASVIAADRPGDDNGIPLINNSLTLEPLFTSGQATDLNTAPGMEISLQYFNQFNVEMEIEGSLIHWDRADTFEGPNLETPFLIGLSPDFIDYNYESDLFSIEWNCRQELAPGLTFLIGPRFLYLEERAQVNTQTTILPPIPLPEFTFFTESTIDTENPLLGVQVGAEWDFQITRDLYANGFIKAGVYENFSSAFVAQSVTGFDDTESDRQKNAGSFVGELGGKIYYSIIPSSCSVFIGYEANWIDNVALAPVQFITFNNLNDDVVLGVTPFFHGAVFGFEFMR